MKFPSQNKELYVVSTVYSGFRKKNILCVFYKWHVKGGKTFACIPSVDAFVFFLFYGIY